MRFTKLFFQGIAETFAITMTMLFAVIMSFLAVFAIFWYTDYLINPLLPLGLIIIWAVFKKDGAIERVIDANSTKEINTDEKEKVDEV